jgi:hypothetical protein
MGVLALTCAGCLQLAAPPADEPLPQPDAATDASPTSPLDASAPPCSNGGAGRLRVSLSLAPSLAARSSDVWLAVQCGDGATPVRIVRWDGSATQTLDGFGPGVWRVYASTLLAPGAWSNTATLGANVATAALSLTLDGEGAVLALAGSGTPTPVDAGTPDGYAPDASAPDASADATPPAWSARIAMRDSADGPSLGWASLTAYPLGADTVEVRVAVQNLCAQAPCAALTLHSVEARTSLDGTPVGFARGVFQTPTLAYGASTVTSPHLVLRGALPDARRTLQIAVYSTAPAARPAAAARRP